MTMGVLERNNLYDESLGYEDETGIRFAPGLTDQERRHATLLYRLFNELWGVIIVVGEPGSGKDLFGNWLSYDLKRFFPQKKILRDERPRPLYGPYAGLFNEESLQEDLAKMREIARGKSDIKRLALMEQYADDWVASEGSVLLHRSVLYLTEFYKYCYRRNPHSPMNITMGSIHKGKRHLDTLIIGTTQLWVDLDRKTCLPFVDWRVTCTRSRRDTTKYTFLVERVKYDRRMDLLSPITKPYPIPLDGGKPLSFLGDGKITVKKPKYKPETDEEDLILEAIKSGLDDYEELVGFLKSEAGLPEEETLLTLKKLSLKLPNERTKFVLDYPCWYKIYNSKSALNIQSTVKVGD